MNLFKMLYQKFSAQSFAKSALKDSENYLESEGEDFAVGFPVYFVENNEPKLVETMTEFLLEDGRTIVTDESGLIAQILPAEMESEVKVEIEVETEPEVETEDESELTMLKSQMDELKTMLSEMKESYKSLNEKVEAMYKAPIESKQKFKKEDYSNFTPGQRKLFNTIN